MGRKVWTRKEAVSVATGRGLELVNVDMPANPRDKSPLMKVRCQRGHEWDTKPGLVKSGHWCPSCLEEGVAVPRAYIPVFERFNLLDQGTSRMAKAPRHLNTEALLTHLFEKVEKFGRAYTKALKELRTRPREASWTLGKANQTFTVLLADLHVLFERGESMDIEASLFAQLLRMVERINESTGDPFQKTFSQDQCEPATQL